MCRGGASTRPGLGALLHSGGSALMADQVAAQGEVRGAEVEQGGTSWALIAALLLMALALLAAHNGRQPSRPRGPDTPAGEFSAARAERVLQGLEGDQQ